MVLFSSDSSVGLGCLWHVLLFNLKHHYSVNFNVLAYSNEDFAKTIPQVKLYIFWLGKEYLTARVK